MSRSRITRALATTAVALLAALAALEADAAAATSLAEVRSRGKLVMLSFPHQESTFIRVNVEVGLDSFDGVDHDLMQGYAKSLGVELEVRPVKPSFSSLLPALLAGEGDVVASSFSITPERRERVDFSDPYFAVRTVVVTRRSSTVSGVAELAGKTGATVKGSSLEERLKGLPGIRLHYVDFTRWNYDAVTAGEADFTVLDSVGVARLLPLYPDLKVAFELPGVDHYGVAVAPGSDLRESLNRYLGEIKRNGKLDEVVRRYLGESASSGVSVTP